MSMLTAGLHGSEPRSSSRRRRWAVILGCLAALGAFGALPRSAEATLYEFTFEGTLEQVDGTPIEPWEGIGVGSPFSFSYVFDSETPDLQTGSLDGLYEGISLSVTMQGATFSTNTVELWTANAGTDEYRVYFYDMPFGMSGDLSMFGLNALPNDDLPLDIDIDQWFSRGFEVINLDFYAFGVPTVFSSRIVPGPGGIVLLVLAAARGARRRRE